MSKAHCKNEEVIKFKKAKLPQAQDSMKPGDFILKCPICSSLIFGCFQEMEQGIWDYGLEQDCRCGVEFNGLIKVPHESGHKKLVLARKKGLVTWGITGSKKLNIKKYRLVPC